MRIKQSDAVDNLVNMGKIWFPSSPAAGLLVFTIPITTISYGQVQLTTSDLLYFTYRTISISVSSAGGGFTSGTVEVIGNSPPAVGSTYDISTGAGIGASPMEMSFSINGSGDLECTVYAGNAGSIQDAQGYFEITRAELFSLQ